jgi:hypothetical protein
MKLEKGLWSTKGVYMKRIIKGLLLTTVCLFLTQCRQEDRFYSNVLRGDQFVQAYTEDRYDFLWVIDNSGSMAPRREYIRDNMQTFLNVMNSRKAIDYRMAVTTVDAFTDNGKLIANNNGQTVVSSESANPVADFAGIINNIQDSPTSFWEQALEGMYQALYQHGPEFLRPGVPLFIILVSDSDDWSCKDECWGGNPETNDHWIAWPTSRYITYLNNLALANESEISVFPITGTEAEDCGYEKTGDRLIEVQQAVGGLGKTASICPSHLADSYTGIAQVVADRGTVFQLKTQASGRGINVFINNQLIPNAPENYIYDADSNSIIFTGMAPKKGDIVEVSYSEKSNVY